MPEEYVFSELKDFIKRLVKTYSSGMYIRLAFSIATSVDPDILIIDEALAVGDEYFQKKSIDRMMNFRDDGKTILFCSHNMYYIQELCNQAVWLHKGEIKCIGDTNKVISGYQNFERSKSADIKKDPSDKITPPKQNGKRPLKITEVKVMDKDLNESSAFSTFETLLVSIRTYCTNEELRGYIGFAIIRNDEVLTFGTLSKFDGCKPVNFAKEQEFKIKIRSLPLLSGLYRIKIIVSDEHAMHPYDVLYSKPFMVRTGLKEFGMTFIEHDWIL